MSALIPGTIYAFLILWIVPFYPRYRNAPKAPWFHIMICAVCAYVVVCACVLMSWQRCDELCVIMPLLIACSYVDQRDMEIPDLPLALIFIYIGLSGRSPHPLAMIIMAIIVIPFVFTKKIGMGDCKMMGLMVLYAGIRAAIGFVIACVLCITVQLAKKESPDQRIPFGPYLCIGFLFTLLSAG